MEFIKIRYAKTLDFNGRIKNAIEPFQEIIEDLECVNEDITTKVINNKDEISELQTRIAMLKKDNHDLLAKKGSNELIINKVKSNFLGGR